MTNKMLIDASHPEETRVVVLRDNQVEEFDFESENKRPLRGNIYLAQVTRVEPSLQAAFVEYGGNRHGFLAFNEIHPDYYQIPVSDREQLLMELDEEERETATIEESNIKPEKSSSDEEDGETENGPSVEDIGGDAHEEASTSGRTRRHSRKYKIQEVIKRRQVILIQVVKEERGNKGAALTTYLSLAGRYCVLMPNTARGGGISRKINNSSDRQKLRKIVEKLDVAKGMGLIIRTAGAQRTSTDIKRDYQYLTRMWENIRTLTMESTAPSLVYEEGSLIKRSIRDLYNKDFDEILIQGDDGYKDAKDYMKMLMPSHARKVKQYKDDTPIFHNNNIETQLSSMFNPVANLPSGGYLVINQTEALVAIDVNSGRATKEHSIEQTALQTNLEAAREVARQARLRDLAGLLVIDFIDMDENRNNRAVERKLKEALKNDRARIQVGKISPFGLLEMSRQRMRSGVLEGSSIACDHCNGTGMVRSVESRALHVLRLIEDEAIKDDGQDTITVRVPAEVASYILNQKRANLSTIETHNDITVTIIIDPELNAMQMMFDNTQMGGQNTLVRMDGESSPAVEENGRDKKRRRRRRRGGKNNGAEDTAQTDYEAASSDNDTQNDTENTPDHQAGHEDDEEKPRRRRRGRRGGRRRRRDHDQTEANGAIEADAEANVETSEADEQATSHTPQLDAPELDAPEVPELDLSELNSDAPDSSSETSDEAAAEVKAEKPKRGRRRAKKAEAEAETVSDEEAPKKKRIRRTKKSETDAETEIVSNTDADTATEAEAEKKKKPKRTRKTKARPEDETKTDASLADNSDADGADDTGSEPKRSGWWSR